MVPQGAKQRGAETSSLLQQHMELGAGEQRAVLVKWWQQLREGSLLLCCQDRLKQGQSLTREAGLALVLWDALLLLLLPSLQKGCGYRLDLFVVSVLLGVCSLMGLPWFVVATVLSIAHVKSLKGESAGSAPGEQPRFLGVREQRVTGLLVFVLMGCSVFLTSVLKVRGQWQPPTSSGFVALPHTHPSASAAAGSCGAGEEVIPDPGA